jgi:AcrR family transcriptional regulator
MTTARSRRLEYAESTRQALVDSAVELFAGQGYAGTSLDEVVKRSRVTKGALYHHFSGKQALFEAALTEVETTVMASIGEIVTGSGDPWEAAIAALRTYMQACLEPAYQRIVLHEGPVVMGWERWREAEERMSFRVVRTAVRTLIDAGEIEDIPLEIGTRLLFGLLSAGANTIASAADPEQAGADVTRCVLRIIEGMRRKSATTAG